MMNAPILIILLAAIAFIKSNALSTPQQLTRTDFGKVIASSLGGGTSIFTARELPPRTSQTALTPPDITTALRFLPNGGCLAVPIRISTSPNSSTGMSSTYYAIVDTGSPFLTGPETDYTLRATSDASPLFPITNEQYGDAIGSMQWRKAHTIVIGSGVSSKGDPSVVALKAADVFLGIPSSNVIRDTGGIFFGLMLMDDIRPAILSQLGYRSFCLDYIRPSLTLSKQSLLLPSQQDDHVLSLFDFSSFGPNLHHYGVHCQRLRLFYSSDSNSSSTPSVRDILTSDLSRPVIAVIDTGLTGCILSDSLLDEIEASSDPTKTIVGAQVHLPTVNNAHAPKKESHVVILQSRPKYWILSSFKLPWFYDEKIHPHVIVLGATFLVDTRITVDMDMGCVKLEVMEGEGSGI